MIAYGHNNKGGTMKTKTRIVVRVHEEEKTIIESTAEARGFNSVSGYIMYLIRHDIKTNQQ
jgi:uncharacterized protein (DUF1778 family)